MAKVKVYGMLIRGTEHVHSSTVDDGPCALFSSRLEIDDYVRVLTEHPEEREWKAAGRPEDKPPTQFTQPWLEIGEGFMTLYIEHADDETWEYLSKLGEDHYIEGSTREKFGVLVTELKYIALEPGGTAPAAEPLLPLTDRSA